MKRVPPFRSLDAIRGFAALWVVFYHSAGPWLITHPAYDGSPLYAVSIHGQLGVVIFFVISGYCITAAAFGALVTGKPVLRYFYERARRIYPPYLAALLLGIAFDAAILYAQGHHLIPPVHHPHTYTLSPRYWLGNLLIIQSELRVPTSNLVFWSLSYEVVFYVFIGLFLFLARKVSIKHGLPGGILCFVSSLGISTLLTLAYMSIARVAIFPFDLWHQFSFGGLLFFFLESIKGPLTGYSQRLRQIVWANCLAVTLLTLFFIAFREVGFIDIGHPSSKLRSSLTLLFCLFLLLLRPYDEKISTHLSMRPWMWLGAFSYSIYLFHSIIIPAVDIISRRLGLDGSKYWLTVLIQVAVGVAAGRIMFLLVERHFISNRQKQRLVSEHVV